MAAVRILAACSPGEVRVAVVGGDNRLIDYALWRSGLPDGVGDLHRGRITAHAAALAGAFVALGGGEDGFLPDSVCEGAPLAGRLLGVRITRAAQGGKGPRLTSRLAPEDAALAASGDVRLLRRGPGAVQILATRYPHAAIEIDDPAMMALLRPTLGDRLYSVRNAFHPTLEDEVAALGEMAVSLAGGGRMLIQPTAALTAIDIDLGGQGGARKSAAHVAFAHAVIPELARQIRLRNLAGAIMVDPAGLSAKRRAGLAPALHAALAPDPVGCRLVGFTGLGLAEIVRTRVHPPLHESLTGPHAAAIAAARAAIAASNTGCVGPAMLAAPAVLRAIEQDAAFRAGLERSAAHALVMRTDSALQPYGWRLITLPNGDSD